MNSESLMTDETPNAATAEDASPWPARFEAAEAGGALPNVEWLPAYRKSAFAQFDELGFPNQRQEDWRFTNVRPLTETPWAGESGEGRALADADAVAALPLAGIAARRFVFVDGRFCPDLSDAPIAEEGITVAPLSVALRDEKIASALKGGWGQVAGRADNGFAALNGAFFEDGMFLHLEKGRALEEAAHFIHLSTERGASRWRHVRHWARLEENAEARFLESYSGLGAAARYVTNALQECSVGDHARWEHLKFQDESPAASHVSGLFAEIGRGAQFRSHSLCLGARLSRNNLRAELAGEGLEAVLNGLYLTKDEQVADHHMIVDHAKPRCESHEYFNGILDGRSKGVFHGRILVRQDAQKTDAKQTNRNLLLSDNATADAKPQLEIYADDVRCTHGATVGQMDDDAIFYLRARGIGLDRARRILMRAFAGEIVERVSWPELRERLDEVIWQRLEERD